VSNEERVFHFMQLLGEYMLNSTFFDCPYCWQTNEIDIDPTEGGKQEFAWDCAVCCRPSRIQAFKKDEEDQEWADETDDGIWEIWATRESD
jgi:hypothetical protein